MALLQDNFWPAMFHDDVGCGTNYDAHSIVSRSASIVSCFLELEKVNHDLENKLRSDFNNILSSMDSLSLSPILQPPSTPPNPPTHTVSSIHNSPFTVAAYSWLLGNIANPYPSLTIKASLAQQFNCTLSAVNTWFVNARKRMGWTALCRDYFNNRRADALDAAYRALVDEDPHRPLPPNVIHAFIGVKATAEALCSTTLTKSAGDLDAVVRNMMDQDIESVGEWKNCEPEGMVEPSVALGAGLQNEELMAQHQYASPDSSCSSSPVPPLVESLTDSSEEEEELSPILVSRKRRLSCSEPAHTAISTQSAKRRKHVCPTIRTSVETCLSSSAETLGNLLHGQKQPSTLTSQSPTNISTSRSLSDVNDIGIHLQELAAEPSPRAILDSLPLSTLESDYSIDEWFNSNFNALFALPPPVDVIEPDPAAQWEVELFSDYSIPPDEPQGGLFMSLNPPDSNRGSTSVDSLVLDDFIQSLESGAFIAPSEFMDPVVAVSAADSIFQELSLESIDWTALLNWQTFDPSLDPIFGQSHKDSLPRPETDHSILQLP